MDTFDELMHDILEAADEATHLNELGPDYTGETRRAQERRTAAVKRLRERWDMLEAACDTLLSLNATAYVSDSCDCGECRATRHARALFDKAQKA